MQTDQTFPLVDEVYCIFSFCLGSTLLNCKLVCKRWSEISKSSIWRNLEESNTKRVFSRVKRILNLSLIPFLEIAATTDITGNTTFSAPNQITLIPNANNQLWLMFPRPHIITGLVTVSNSHGPTRSGVRVRLKLFFFDSSWYELFFLFEQVLEKNQVIAHAENSQFFKFLHVRKMVCSVQLHISLEQHTEIRYYPNTIRVYGFCEEQIRNVEKTPLTNLLQNIHPNVVFTAICIYSRMFNIKMIPNCEKFQANCPFPRVETMKTLISLVFREISLIHVLHWFQGISYLLTDPSNCDLFLKIVAEREKHKFLLLFSILRHDLYVYQRLPDLDKRIKDEILIQQIQTEILLIANRTSFGAQLEAETKQASLELKRFREYHNLAGSLEKSMLKMTLQVCEEIVCATEHRKPSMFTMA